MDEIKVNSRVRVVSDWYCGSAFHGETGTVEYFPDHKARVRFDKPREFRAYPEYGIPAYTEYVFDFDLECLELINVS